MIVFISGGVRSGKSRIAETYVQKLAAPESALHYIATARASDDEMKQRIAHHRKQRQKQAVKWVTWEQPVQLDKLISVFTKNDVILLDCVTNWLANELFVDESWQKETVCFDKARKMWETLQQLENASRALIVVSNELFSGGVPDDLGTYHFMKTLGWLHQQIVSSAQVAILAQNGIAVVKKGESCL
ncbi:bifunctional adenosylcobinamide kinase/adenosylcobinamide-phosphate guanylyltransferase [Parageobacillus thermoglucosidasius]|uniref:bifunctional adenosylcobinamide kinase/adenosylcobinamide-phosphate guanylyltransferase n=1 Tax=Parageobacillus thermoglucosidasius TaxID=1426 RepID=UPI00025B818A|nr:bifunctional adenosylcobinamide kinase/adenosylcobinamide-phosphate guanylyltransferase [Parageobacillus thermoglucosidasius]EID44991.1 bifunctional adenosylcobalamin biosynthesis protein: cobinamide kinase / cobinamide phosphate guanyltransferase [Parageobacillus thermoglucosidasius TNO-09.020]KYD16556.1 Adenosylcobinamide-phosphate guanylyltransferase [Anoxybacillus flavithermus]OAO88297.1 Adenosylcobinamide-phosphate guanylyltransferase [Parageobacillus thermoglucosidasius]